MDKKTKQFIEAIKSLKNDGAIDESTANRIVESATSPDESKDWTADVDNLLQSDEFKNLLKTNKRKAALRNILNFSADVLDLQTAKSQIKASEGFLKDLRKPNRPSIPSKDKGLSDALNQAKIESQDPDFFGEVQAQKEANLDHYRRNLLIAEAFSGGQAGRFASRAQAASNDLLRRNRELAGLPRAIRDDARRREDDIRRQSLAEDRYLQGLEESRYLQDLGQYNRESAAYGQLGATGGLNLVNARRRLLGQAPDLLSSIGDAFSVGKAVIDNRSENNKMLFGEEEGRMMDEIEYNYFDSLQDPESFIDYNNLT